MSQYLFVMGLGRSGTTAFTEVLNSHPEISLGMERYKKLWSNLSLLTPEHFEESRFFNFGDGLTNLEPSVPRWAEYYADTRRKYSQSIYHGDKITRATIPAVLRNFPHAKIAFIAREVAPLAFSWQARATNPEDKGWPEKNDGIAAIEAWNRGMQHAITAATFNPANVSIVEYDAFFGDPKAKSLRRLLDRLGLDWTSEMDRGFGVAHDRYRDVVSTKARTLDGAVRAAIARDANPKLWDRVCQSAL